MSRRRPNFSTRTAQEDVARLDPNESEGTAPPERAGFLHWPPTLWSRHQGVTSTDPPEHHHHLVPANPFRGISEWWNKKTGHEQGQEDSGVAGLSTTAGLFRDNSADRKDKHMHRSRSFEETKKLGTFSGVFVPTSLNVLSILMFLRFGFILGQAGLLGILGEFSVWIVASCRVNANQSTTGLLALSYLINLVTTMSLSAIATNGTVRGGGAYYLISRSLGPEFGGSIGVVFYLGLVFNTGMNAVGLVDCFTQNFGTMSGTLGHFLQEGFWWQYLWGTVILVLCTAICLAGSSIFARASNGLLVLLLIATFSIPVSAILMKPFNSPVDNVVFTGLSWQTLKENLTPQLTKGAAGSQSKGRETFQDLFGILFPATGGIFA
jgi:potassium/chloride transporter 9